MVIMIVVEAVSNKVLAVVMTYSKYNCNAALKFYYI